MIQANADFEQMSAGDTSHNRNARERYLLMKHRGHQAGDVATTSVHKRPGGLRLVILQNRAIVELLLSCEQIRELDAFANEIKGYK